MDQVHNVFFGTPQRPMRMQPDPCGYDAIPLQEAREIATQLRTGVLTAVDHEAAPREEFGAFSAASRARLDRERDEEPREVSPDPRVQFGSRRPYARGDCVVRHAPSNGGAGPSPSYDGEDELDADDVEESEGEEEE